MEGAIYKLNKLVWRNMQMNQFKKTTYLAFLEFSSKKSTGDKI